MAAQSKAQRADKDGDVELTGIIENVPAPSLLRDVQAASLAALADGNQMEHAYLESVLIHLHWLKERMQNGDNPSLEKLKRML